MRFIFAAFLTVTAMMAESAPGARVPASALESVYRLASFVSWPESAVRRGPFRIGIAGSDPADPAWNGLALPRTIAGRLVEVRRITTPAQMRQCQVVFFGRSLRGQVKRMLPDAEKAGVLTVAAYVGFVEMGGMVELSLRPQMRPVTVNTEAARRAGLRFLPGLLTVCNLVRREDATE